MDSVKAFVSGAFEADNYQISRGNYQVKSTIVEKCKKYVQCLENNGLKVVDVDPEMVKADSLNDEKLKKVVHLGEKIEKTFNAPMDIEWAHERK